MDKRKTINIVCDYASIYGGNFIPSIVRLAQNLSDYKVIFTFPKDAYGRNWLLYFQNSFKVYFIDFSKKCFSKELRFINKKNCVNIVYTHFVSGLKIKMVYPFARSRKLIIHVHSDFSGGDKQSAWQKIKQFVETRILRRDARYIVVSDYLKQRLACNLCYIPNALIIDRMSPSYNADIFRKQNGISNADTVFLMFAWSPFIKGVDIALKGFLRGTHARKNDKLLIVYGRDDKYERCVNFLKDAIGNDSFLKDERIIFCPPQENVFVYYEISDIFISSSRSEGFSYSILEALYFNLKIISSDIVGTRWALNYSNVIPFASENINELEKVIWKNSAFKKDKKVNEQILVDYNIDAWCKKVSAEIRKIY